MVVTAHWWWENCSTVNPREERFSTVLGHALHAFIYNIHTAIVCTVCIVQSFSSADIPFVDMVRRCTSTNSCTKFNVFSVCMHSSFIRCKLNLYACIHDTALALECIMQGYEKNTHYIHSNISCLLMCSRQPHHYIFLCQCNESTVCISAAQLSHYRSQVQVCALPW